MKYRRLDKNGDMVFGQGAQDFLVDSRETVAQACMTRLKLLYGEWWEDIQSGFPLWQTILGSRVTESTLASINQLYATRILGTEGVTSIESYEASFNSQSRQYSFTAIINTRYGETTIEG